jgi:hypothetical protein
LVEFLAPIPVFDDVPAGQVRPYVSLEDFTSDPWNTQTHSGEDCTLTFAGNSGYRGALEAAGMAEAIRLALTTPLSLEDGFVIVQVTAEFNTTVRDPDGLGRKAVVRMRWLVQSTW